MMYSGDEDYGDEITSGLFPNGMREPEFEGPYDDRDDWPDDEED